jgi:putative Ca2+/H+ antiporter (TMEM165/GDT1 family)
MEAFIVSTGTVLLAEMGDRTQLLALVLTARFRKPWPILAGILLATLANHLVAGLIGVWFGKFLTLGILDAVVGVSMLGMALWSLKADTLDEKAGTAGRTGAFVTTLIAFFIAEIGDKTQITTIALAAAYAHLAPVVAGTTLGMMTANVPVVFLGNAFCDRLPLRFMHFGAAVLFAVLGVVFILRAIMEWS